MQVTAEESRSKSRDETINSTRVEAEKPACIR